MAMAADMHRRHGGETWRYVAVIDCLMYGFASAFLWCYGRGNGGWMDIDLQIMDFLWGVHSMELNERN